MMDSYSGGRRGGKARGRAAAPPHHCEEVRGERDENVMGTQKGPPKRALRCGGKCGPKRKAPWRNPGRCVAYAALSPLVIQGVFLHRRESYSPAVLVRARIYLAYDAEPICPGPPRPALTRGGRSHRLIFMAKTRLCTVHAHRRNHYERENCQIPYQSSEARSLKMESESSFHSSGTWATDEVRLGL